jgi:hypothetical protein
LAHNASGTQAAYAQKLRRAEGEVREWFWFRRELGTRGSHGYFWLKTKNFFLRWSRPRLRQNSLFFSQKSLMISMSPISRRSHAAVRTAVSFF